MSETSWNWPHPIPIYVYILRKMPIYWNLNETNNRRAAAQLDSVLYRPSALNFQLDEHQGSPAPQSETLQVQKPICVKSVNLLIICWTRSCTPSASGGIEHSHLHRHTYAPEYGRGITAFRLTFMHDQANVFAFHSPSAVRHRYSPLLTFPFPSFGKSMPPRGSSESFESGKGNIFDSIFCQLPETLSCRRMTNTLCTCHRNITHTHRGLPSFRLRNSNILNLESSSPSTLLGPSALKAIFVFRFCIFCGQFG